MTEPVKIHTYAYNIGLMDGDTSHMSPAEFGIYQRLVNKYFNDGHLDHDFDGCCQITGCTTPQDIESAQKVLKKMFRKKRNGYYRTAIDDKINLIRTKSAQNSQKSSKAARQMWKNNRMKKANEINADDVFAFLDHATSMPAARLEHANTVSSIKSKKEEKELSIDNPSPPFLPQVGEGKFGFEEFFVAYPNPVGRYVAEGAWRRMTLEGGVNPDDIRRGLIWWVGRWSELGRKTSKIPDPCNWLMDRKWLDAPVDFDSSVNVPVAKWSGPEHVRRRVWELGGDTAVASYLDSASWDGTDTIITRFGVAADRLKALLGNEFNVVVRKVAA